MKALQYRTIGSPPEVVEIETPEPGPGQVRIKVSTYDGPAMLMYISSEVGSVRSL